MLVKDCVFSHPIVNDGAVQYRSYWVYTVGEVQYTEVVEWTPALAEMFRRLLYRDSAEEAF